MSGSPRSGDWHERPPAGCATDREVVVVAAVLVAGSEKAAAHRLGRLSPSSSPSDGAPRQAATALGAPRERHLITGGPAYGA